MNSSSAKKIAETSQEILWFVARGHVLKGPYTTDQLFDGIRRKEIGFLDFCWRQGFREWRPISAVDDLDRRQRLKRLPAYPSVEVPCGGIVDAPPTRPVIVGRGEPRSVKVNFSRTKRYNISHYEWALAIVFAVGFAHVSTQFALDRVSGDFRRLWEMKALGRVETTGDLNPAPPPEVWAPLFSAPSFAETAESGLVSMDVQWMGSPRSQGPNVLLSGYSVTGPLAAFEAWKVQDTELDPVYTRAFEIHGKLSTHDAHVVHIQATGEPWLDGSLSSLPSLSP